MSTPTNDWDLVFGLNQDFLSKLTSKIFDDGRVPGFNGEINGCLIELVIIGLTAAFTGDVSDTGNQADGDTGSDNTPAGLPTPNEPCSFTGETQLLAITAQVDGTMTCNNAPPEELHGPVIITMNLAEVAFSAVSQPNYLQFGGDPAAAADAGSPDTFTSGGCTLEAWIKTSSGSFQTIFLFGEATPSLSIVNDNLRLYWGGDYYDSNDPTKAGISDGKWHHVAITVDAGMIYFYKDGQLKNSFPLPSEQQSSGSLRLGAAYSYSFGGASAFDGSLTQVRVWNNARSATEIQQAMNTLLAGSEKGLIGYWTFENQSVANLVNNTQGTLSGDAQIVNLVYKDDDGSDDKEASSISYDLNLYFLAPDNVFCVSCDVGDDKTNKTFETQIQNYLDEKVVIAPLSLGVLTPSKKKAASTKAMLPTYAVTALLQNESGTPDELIVMGMAQNKPRPAGGSGFSDDVRVTLPTDSNLLMGLWDYYLFDSLFAPALAKSFEVDDSYFSVSQEPAVLSLQKDVKIKKRIDKLNLDVELTITELSMQIKEEGLRIDLASKTQPTPTLVPWLIYFSATLGVRVQTSSDGTETIACYLSDQSISIMPDLSDPDVWEAGTGFIILALIFPELAVVLLVLWMVITAIVVQLVEFMALDKIEDAVAKKSKSVPSSALTIKDIVFDQGIWFYLNFNPDTSAQALTTARAATNEGSSTSTADDIAAPVIDDFSPPSGSASTLVTIRGTGFNAASAVRFDNASAVYFRVMGDDEIIARPGPAAASGPVSVTTPHGTGTSNASFVILAVPTITGFSHSDEIQLSGDEVTITGTNFDGASSVTFGNSKVPAASFSVSADGTQINATIPAGAISGPISVVVPGGKATSEQPILIGSLELPAITSFSPEAGTPQTSVTIEGAHFAGTTAVEFSGVPSKSFSLLSDSQLIAYVPDFPKLTTGPITVANNQGTSPASVDFTVTPGPSVLGFDPTAGESGQDVKITGSNLGGATSVSFGNNKRQAEFNPVSDTEVAAAVPAGAVNGPIAVTTPSGTGTSTDGFTVLSSAPPANLSFSPTAGGPGEAVTITGANFTGTILVTFNGALATPYVVQSDTEITAYVPTNATTGPIEVCNSTNPIEPTRSAQIFTVYPAPQITNVNHSSGVAGSSVSIYGQNFEGASAVTFGANKMAAASFNVSADGTIINTNVPSGAVNGPIMVTTPGGSAVSQFIFEVESGGAPSEITFSPPSGGVGSQVTIEGRNFTGTTEVSFPNQTRSTSYQVESDTQITARVPQGATTGPITITNTVASASSATAFTVGSDSNIE
jgi:hypothetical protein